MMKLQILNTAGDILQETDSSLSFITLLYDEEYKEGDTIRFLTDRPGYYTIMLDDTLGKASLLLTDTSFTWKIPFGLLRKRYNPRAFAGTRHYLTAEKDTPDFLKQERNLSCNIYDQAEASNGYPHAWSNVITPDKPEFDAQNAIDGIIYPWVHGRYPYESWGINRRQDAEWHLDFGRPIHADKIIITLRADFPHDSYWDSIDLDLSNGTHLVLSLTKTGDPQEFSLMTGPFQNLMLSHFHLGDTSSPFPALTQVQIIGTDL